MKKLVTGALVIAAFTSGCAIQLDPAKRPMQQATLDQLKGPIPVIMQTPERNGIATSYFAQDSSAAGAQYGLIGALTTAVIDGIANANPYEIAQNNANRIAETFKGDELLNQAYASLTANKKLAPTSLNLVLSAPTTPDGLSIDLGYVFQTNMSAIKVYAMVSLNMKGAEYKSPYISKDGKPAKADTSGLVYKNWFQYYSVQLPVPVKAQSDIDAKVAEIKAAATKNGALPKKDTQAYAKMMADIKQAQKVEYTAKEVTDKLANQWLANNGEKLKAEIKTAHEFLATQIYKDLARLDVPDYKGTTDTVLDTAADGRTIKLLGVGYNAGMVRSQPKDFIETGWGNATIYPETEKEKAAEKAKTKTKDKAKDKAKDK